MPQRHSSVGKATFKRSRVMVQLYLCEFESWPRHKVVGKILVVPSVVCVIKANTIVIYDIGVVIFTRLILAEKFTSMVL